MREESAIFQVAECQEIWNQSLQKEGFITWQQVRCKALAIAQSLPTENKPFQALIAAKGLEFPFVVLALAQSQFPQILPYQLPREEQQLYLDNQRRLFYVGCSRAMRKLLVTLSSSNIVFFDNLIPPYWQRS